MIARLASAITIITLLLVLLVDSHAAGEHGKLPPHSTYLAWHNQCLTGDLKEINTQIQKFETAIAAKPNDHLAQAYLGSAYALRAKASFWPGTKLSNLKKGKKLMDTAITSAPSNPRVRMVRAIAYSKAPKRFKLRPTSISDFETLLPVVSTSHSSLSTNERQAILYYTYLTFKAEHHADTAKVKKLCHQINPNSKYGKFTSTHD